MTALQQVGTSSDKGEYRVALVPTHLMGQVWPRVEAILEANPLRGSPLFYTAAQVFRELMDGRFILWIGGEENDITAIHICSIVQYPATKTLVVNYVGGENLRAAMKVAAPIVERWALQQGCTHIELTGPRSVLRILRKWGYKPIAEYACKPLISFNS